MYGRFSTKSAIYKRVLCKYQMSHICSNSFIYHGIFWIFYRLRKGKGRFCQFYDRLKMFEIAHLQFVATHIRHKCMLPDDQSTNWFVLSRLPWWYLFVTVCNRKPTVFPEIPSSDFHSRRRLPTLVFTPINQRNGKIYIVLMHALRRHILNTLVFFYVCSDYSV